MITITANRSNYGVLRNESDIKYIVIHYTANQNDTARGNANYFKNNVTESSAHYFVDDAETVMSVSPEYVAWSVGGSLYANAALTGGGEFYRKCTNQNSVSIELCDGITDFKPQTIDNAIKLTRELIKKYNISENNVIRHFDVTGKPCPKPFLDNEKWNMFKSFLNGGEIMEELNLLKKRVEELERKNTVYNWTLACPEWSIPYVQKALDLGLIKGDENGLLGLNDDRIWSLVVMLRKDGLMD